MKYKLNNKRTLIGLLVFSFFLSSCTIGDIENINNTSGKKEIVEETQISPEKSKSANLLKNAGIEDFDIVNGKLTETFFSEKGIQNQRSKDFLNLLFQLEKKGDGCKYWNQGISYLYDKDLIITKVTQKRVD